MKLLIIIQHPFALWNAPQWLGERIHRDFPQIEVDQRNTYKNVEDHIRDAEIFFGWSLRGEQVRTAKKLRWIHSTAAAVHQLMSPELLLSDIIVTNARSVHGPVVAEHAIGLMFALAKRLPAAVRYQQQQVWAQEQVSCQHPHPTELAGSILGLIGYGAIGSEVARSAAALGMRVLVARLHPQKDSGVKQDVETFALDRLDDVISQSDFLVLAAPLTEKTRHIINTERLARMKPEGYVINVARGALIDEAALTEALRNGRIGGAALDVFDQEPLPAGSPLWELDNLLITPHTAATTDKMWERHYALIKENLRRYLAGEPLLGLVDKQVGY
ncbi:MAG TPA: D-2-hydroxyacid dehydrogenase [Terriglobales bacterium]|nr:D-2-hydroxyacid dehydrogenase [Terriglobales bacterium]